MAEVTLDTAREHAEEIIAYEKYHELLERDPGQREAVKKELATLVLARLATPGQVEFHEAVIELTNSML
ncbi:MAG: hypothetical protein KDD73_02020 [Anaerolineales bacterium]|nr:hypothetical protein [Anaerolineales bacterium]MCB9126346.1 hypothetical protein [Ardenticatenales bacterium]